MMDKFDVFDIPAPYLAITHVMNISVIDFHQYRLQKKYFGVNFM